MKSRWAMFGALALVGLPGWALGQVGRAGGGGDLRLAPLGEALPAKLAQDYATDITPEQVKAINKAQVEMTADLLKQRWYTMSSLVTRTWYVWGEPVPGFAPRGSKPEGLRPKPRVSTYRLTMTRGFPIWTIETVPLSIDKEEITKSFNRKGERKPEAIENESLFELYLQQCALDTRAQAFFDVDGTDPGKQLIYQKAMKHWESLAAEGLTDNKPAAPMRMPAISDAVYERTRIPTEPDDRLPPEAKADLTVREVEHKVSKQGNAYRDLANGAIRVVQYDAAAGMRPRKVEEFRHSGAGPAFILRLKWVNIGTADKPEWFAATIDLDGYVMPGEGNDGSAGHILANNETVEIDVSKIVRHASPYTPSPMYKPGRGAAVSPSR